MVREGHIKTSFDDFQKKGIYSASRTGRRRVKRTGPGATSVEAPRPRQDPHDQVVVAAAVVAAAAAAAIFGPGECGGGRGDAERLPGPVLDGPGLVARRAGLGGVVRGVDHGEEREGAAEPDLAACQEAGGELGQRGARPRERVGGPGPVGGALDLGGEDLVHGDGVDDLEVAVGGRGFEGLGERRGDAAPPATVLAAPALELAGDDEQASLCDDEQPVLPCGAEVLGLGPLAIEFLDPQLEFR